MRLRDWKNGVLGNTPLAADRLNGVEDDIGAMLLQLGASPPMLFSGAVTVNTDGAPVSASVRWPNGTVGVYSGTASTAFPGAVDAYTITYAGSPTITVTQPAVTRNAAGQVTNSPALTIT